MTQDFTQASSADAALDAQTMQKLNALNTVGSISYVLHLIVAVAALIPGGQFGTVLLLAALILDMVKRDAARGTWHASHFRWRIRTVILAGLLYFVTAPLWFLFIFPGWIAWVGISIWFFYRIVSGLVRMNKGLAMEVSA